MLKIKLIFLSVFTLGLFKFGVAQSDIGNKYLADFNMLVTNLKELHPMLYKNISEDEFNAEVKKISERLIYTNTQNQAIFLYKSSYIKLVMDTRETFLFTMETLE